MKRLERVGSVVFDAVLVALILALAFALVLPFLAVLTAATAWFQAQAGERDLSVFFGALRATWKRSLPYGAALALAAGVAVLDIAYFGQYAFPGSNVVLSLSWVLLFLVFVTLVEGPTILHRMRVSLAQLVFDAFVLAVAAPLPFLLSAALHAAIVVLAFLVPVLVPFLFLPFLYGAAILTGSAFDRLESRQHPHSTGGKTQ